jgi:hypothetical protein
MAERYTTTDGGTRVFRLRTDDGPVAELILSVSDSTIDARISVYEVAASQPLTDLTGQLLRDRRGVVDKVARLILKPNPTDEDLWTFIGQAYAVHASRWAKALSAAQSAADAAVAAAPGVDRAALIRQITATAFSQLP